MTNDALTEEQKEQYEEQFKDLDPKLIQIQILSELQAIRTLLQESGTQTQEDSTERFVCNRCSWVGSKEERRAHARDTHKAPADMLDSLFTREGKG